MKKRRILFYLLFFLIIAFLFFYLNPPDTLIKYIPTEASLYFHLNLNNNYLAGYRAKNFLKKYLSESLLKPFQEKFLTYSPLLKLINEENINKINELAFSLYKNKPILIFRLKKPEENIVVRDKNVFSFANGDILFFALDKELFSKFSQKKEKNFYQRIKRPFLEKRIINNNFLTFYLEKRIFKNLINSDILAELNSKEILGFYGQIYKDKIVFSVKANKNKTSKKRIDGDLVKFIPEEKNIFAIFDFSRIEKFLSPIIKKNVIDKISNSVFLVSDKNYVFIFKSKDINLDKLEKQIAINLSYVYPQEVERMLPDGTKITELIANPSYFKFEIQKENNFRYLKLPDGKEIFLAKKENNIFLSNSKDFLKKVFFVDNKLAFSRIRNSEFKFSNNLFYLVPFSDVFKYILAGYSSNFSYYLINLYY